MLHDSGERQEFDTGAVRDPQQGKGRYDLISPYALKRLALHYEAGAAKYDDRNWEQGIPASRCFSSAVRHLFQWLAGQRDEDHLAAAAWNIFAIIHFEEVKPEMIDVGKSKAVDYNAIRTAHIDPEKIQVEVGGSGEWKGFVENTCKWCNESIPEGDAYMDGTGKYHAECFPFHNAEIRAGRRR